MYYVVEKWNNSLQAWLIQGEITPIKQVAMDRYNSLRGRYDFEHFRVIAVLEEG